MDKIIFEKSFSDNLNKNFPSQSKYFDFQFNVFQELGPPIFEINKCLILEFYRASITLKNNVLERLLKLALIYHDAGIGPQPTENWNSIFEGPNKKYGSIVLNTSIDYCKKLGLISTEEKDVLDNIIRELFRNGFSHADSSKILADIPESIMFEASISNPTEIRPVKVDFKKIPFLQAVQMDEFAKYNALKYFVFVFELIHKIENRLIEKQNKTSS